MQFPLGGNLTTVLAKMSIACLFNKLPLQFVIFHPARFPLVLSGNIFNIPLRNQFPSNNPL